MTASPPPYIQFCDQEIIGVKCSDNDLVKILGNLGFQEQAQEKSIYTFKIAGEEDKARILSTLRDNGFYFSYGKEWNPAEVFEYLRENGKISGSYKMISWKNQQEFILKENL